MIKNAQSDAFSRSCLELFLCIEVPLVVAVE